MRQDGSNAVLADLEYAVDNKLLKPKSTVVLVVPDSWLEGEPSKQLAATVAKLQEADINVMLSRPDRALHGDLGGEAVDRASSVDEMKLCKDGELPSEIPMLTTRKLLSSLVDIVGPEAAREKVVVLGDAQSRLHGFSGAHQFNAVGHLASGSPWSDGGASAPNNGGQIRVFLEKMKSPPAAR
ncbi:MAG: hypothetical protein ABW032_10635 [Burkholderiaceae bacterium]